MMRVMWLVVLVCVVVCSAMMSRDELEDFTNFLERTSSLDLNVKKGTDPDDAFDEDEEVSDHAWEESGKFEGDLILNDRQRRLIVETVVGLSRNGLKDSTKKWPNNEVIYFIQKEHFNGGQVQAIMDGIDDLARASCVKFRPYRKGDRDAVVIQGSRRGCFSQVGYQGGYQVLNLSGRHPVGRGCFRHGTVVHELLHALGFYHMQSSHDRDDYIDVVWTNIVQPARHNFRKYNSFAVSDFGVGYDYDSVLHYSRRAFSANGQDTLVPKKSGVEIGQRVGLSDKDTQKLNRMYCDADSDSFQADENTTKKPIIKKKPKNQPFEGHGIGYHQGKTVVIKLPVAETYKLANAPSIDVYDFSKTPQAVSTPEDEGYRFGKDITYPYKTPIRLNTDAATGYKNQNNYYEDKPNDSKRLPKEHRASYDDDNTTKLEKNGNITNNSNEQSLNTPTDEKDEDLKDAFDRLTSIVKQHVYPQTQIEGYKINKDYSKFYEPPQFKRITMTYKDLLDEKFEKPYETQNNVKLGKYEHDDKHSSKEKSDLIMKQNEDIIDESYRTSLPIKKPYSLTYSAYQQTETPKYATLEYLRDRQNYSSLYSPKATDSEKTSGPHIILGDKLPPTENDWYKKDSLKHKTPSSYEGFYTDYVSKESKERLTDASNDYDHKTRTKSPTRVKDEYPVEHSNWYYTDYVKKDNERLTDESSDDDENSSERPNKSQAYTKFGSPVSSHWYEPSYTIPTQIRLRNPYSDDTSESLEDNR